MRWIVAAIALLSTIASAAPKHPNVLVFVADDLGWNDLGYTGSKFYESPNIDSLAKRGCVFTQAYAACPVCSPTRAALMTGKYPQRVHITDYIGGPQPEEAAQMPKYKDRLLPAPYQEQLALEEVTIGEAFKAQGYATFFAGKWHLGHEKFYPDKQGFDVTFGAGHQGSPGKNGYFSPYNVPLSNGPVGEHLDKRLATEAAKWMATQKDRPFLLWMSFYDVHIPFMAPAETIAYFEAKKKRVGLEDAFADEGKSRVRTVQCHTTYAAMIKTMDDCVGILLKQLEAQHQLENTIIVFTSDNGGLSTAEGAPTSNLPLRGGKGWAYEGGTRVPLLVIAPGYTRPGTHSDEPAISLDLYPTLLSAAGAPRPETVQLDGIDLVPEMAGMPDHRPGRSLFWHYPHYGNQGGSPFSSVRLGNYKLIEFHDPRQGIELYDLAADPSEKQNIASANADKVKELHDMLAAWKKDVGAIDATKQ